jgi:hypothetical protein
MSEVTSEDREFLQDVPRWALSGGWLGAGQSHANGSSYWLTAPSTCEASTAPPIAGKIRPPESQSPPNSVARRRGTVYAPQIMCEIHGVQDNGLVASARRKTNKPAALPICPLCLTNMYMRLASSFCHRSSRYSARDVLERGIWVPITVGIKGGNCAYDAKCVVRVTHARLL